MLTLKRLLLIVTTLLCALSIAACSGTSGTNAQAAAANSSNSGVSTTNEIAKETTQSQASKQTTTNKQASNQTSTNQSNAQVNASVNNSQQASAQTNVSLNTQSSQQKTSAQNNNNNSTQKTNKQTTQNTVQNNNNLSVNNTRQTSHSSSSTNTSSYNDNTSNSSSSSNSNSSSGTIYIKVAQISINGQMTNVLTTGNGMTLYYDSNDSAMNATCTGGCAQTWPPLLAQGQIITSASITSGMITEQATANGSQVEYNGHPLYTYVNDTAAGQVNGQGVNNVWYAASSVTTQKLKW